MTVRAKLVAGIGTTIAVFALLGFFVLRVQDSHLKDINSLRAQMEKLSLIDSLQLSLNDSLRIGSSFIITGNAEYARKFQKFDAEIVGRFGELQKNPIITADEKETLGRSLKSYGQARDIYERFFSGEFSRQGMGPMMGEASFGHTTTAVRELDSLRSGVQAALRTAEAKTSREGQVTIYLFAIVFVVLLAAGGLSGYALYGSIVDPIDAVQKIAGHIADGDLRPQESFVIGTRDEVGRLMGSIETMRSGLSSLIVHARGSLSGVRRHASAFADAVNGITEGSGRQLRDSSDISSSVREVTRKTGEVAQGVVDLHSISEDSMATILQMKASLEEVAENTGFFADFIDKTSSSIQESFAAGRSIEQSIEQSGSEINSTLASVTQMEQSSRLISDSAKRSSLLAGQVAESIRDRGVKFIEGSVNSMKGIEASAAETAGAVHDMERSSEKIDSMVHFIEDVADSTELLAMNASILAAQAGRFGQGFGVVAGEIKRMALSTSKNTKDIAMTVGEIKSSIQNLVAAQKRTMHLIAEGSELITKAGEVFEGILETSTESANASAFIEKSATEQTGAVVEMRSSVEEINSVMQEIVGASGQQREGTNAILQGVEQMKDIAQRLKDATSEQSGGADNIARGSEEVVARVEQVKAAMEEMQSGALDIAERIEEITQVAGGNMQQAKSMNEEARGLQGSVQALQDELGKFKV